MVFNLPHIFIVFEPGTGGNFIASILNNLVHNTLSEVVVSPSGGCHNHVNDKITGTDFLSFGTVLEEHLQFSTSIEREDYYIGEIKARYNDITQPMVVWTHDLTNISLYRKYFKNSKILVITADSLKEQLVAMFMHITKTFMDRSAIIPLPKNIEEYIADEWKTSCKKILVSLTDEESSNLILCNMKNVRYRNISLLVTMQYLLTKQNLLEFIETKSDQNNTITYSSVNNYIDDSCIKLPYSYLLDNDPNILISSLEKIFERTFTNTEYDFIMNSYNKYRVTQDNMLLNDPITFYQTIKESAYLIKNENGTRLLYRQ